MATKIGCSLSSSASSPFHFQHRRNSQLSLSQLIKQQSGAQLAIYGKDKSYQFMHGMPKLQGRLQKQQTAPFVSFEDHLRNCELEITALVAENIEPDPEDISPVGNSSFHSSGSDGKPGIISFYSGPYGRNRRVTPSSLERTHSSKLWFLGPAVIVTSFVFPAFDVRRVLRHVFEDSLSTDFFIIFLNEAVFYCGVAVFLLLLDHSRRPMQLDSVANNNDTLPPQLGPRIFSVATLVLTLTVPMVTMGLVWPWIGPAASATLSPYLVGIIVQFAFEQYARYWKSPSWVAIPFIFQVYRVQQLNRAAQLVSSLSHAAKGAELAPHTLAINGALGAVSNVLEFLLVISIWSISSFIVRFLPSTSATMH